MPSLHAYYFGANCYTLVPRHIDEDLAWMADHGTSSVCLGVIESQLRSGRQNIDHIASLAEKRGLTVDLVPSFVCGLVAGAPHVPCPWLSFRPETWARNEDGTVQMRGSGPLGSIYHPAVFEHLVETVDQMLTAWPFGRVIWDEPKCFVPDWFPDGSDAAKAVNPEMDWDGHVRVGCDFFSRANDVLRTRHPKVQFWLFDEAFKDDLTVECASQIGGLDAFGVDGRPWRTEESRLEGKRARKSIVSEGGRFMAAARTTGVRSLALIENHKLEASEIELMDRRLPEVFAMGWDHLIYYYYPNGCEKPEESMEVLGRHLRSL
jgi:hypothetical protein